MARAGGHDVGAEDMPGIKLPLEVGELSDEDLGKVAAGISTAVATIDIATIDIATIDIATVGTATVVGMEAAVIV